MQYIYRFFVFGFLFFTGGNLLATNVVGGSLKLYSDSLIVDCESSVEFDIKVDSFESIVTMQFSVEWDTAYLSFDSISTITPGLPGLVPTSFGYFEVASGRLRVIWTDPNFTGFTLPDGTALFKVHFTPVAAMDGSASSIGFNGITGNMGTFSFSDPAGVVSVDLFPGEARFEDISDPTIAFCPDNMLVNVDPGNCNAVVNYSLPIFNDNCDGPGLAGTLAAGLPSGSVFPVGITTIVYEYNDDWNNSTSCIFTVEVSTGDPVVAGCDYICSGSDSLTYTYTLTGFTVTSDSIIWDIPYGEVLFGQGTNNIIARYNETSPSGSSDLVVYFYNVCNIDTLYYNIQMDANCVWPGDIDNDGTVDWATDWLALFEANNTQTVPGLPRQLPCNVAIPTPYEWMPFLAPDWGEEFLMGNPIDLKYADTNGDGELEINASGLDYNPADPPITDADVLYHHSTKEHDGNNFSFAPNPASYDLRVDTFYNVLTAEGHELRLNITLGDSDVPVEDVKGVACKLRYQTGRYNNPNVVLEESHLRQGGGILDSVEYRVFHLDDNTGDTLDVTTHMGVGRLNGSVDFAGEVVFKAICIGDLPIDGLKKGEEDIFLSNDDIDTLHFYIENPSLLLEDGTSIPLNGFEIPIPLRWVEEPPVSLFSYTTDNDNRQVQFTEECDNFVNSYFWEFGDGEFSYEENPLHAYTADGTYEVCLKASNSAGEDMFCDSVTVEMPTVDAVNEVGNLDAIVNIIPNPTNGIAQMTIEVENNMWVQLELFNHLGQKVKTQEYTLVMGQNHIPLDLTDLENGIYHYRASNSAGQITRKLILLK